jgi:hypothetical protein
MIPGELGIAGLGTPHSCNENGDDQNAKRDDSRIRVQAVPRL